MKNISIREIRENDAVFLHYLMNDESILKSLTEVPTTLEFWESAIIDWNNDNDEEDYLIMKNNHPIGWLGINNLSSDNKQVFLKMLAILPEKQGQGIGEYVVNDILADLKSRGFKSIGLYTDSDNISAQKCYQKCGLITTEKVKQKMSNGEYVKRDKMERIL